MTTRRFARIGFAAGFFVALAGTPSRAQTQIAGWGYQVFDSRANEFLYSKVSAGVSHTLALRNDGTIVAWGGNWIAQSEPPAPAAGTSFVAVAAGFQHSLALRSDGLVVGWGSNNYGQLNIPALPAGKTYVEIEAATYHTLLRRSDGALACFGSNTHGQLNAPSGTNFVEVSAAQYFSLARRTDGTVVAWGQNNFGQCNVPALPAGLTYVQIAAGGGTGESHGLARRSDGSVVAWGNNSYGQCNVPALPVGVTYTDIDAGGSFSIARRSDGATVAWGASYYGQNVVPFTASPFVEISAGGYHGVAIRASGTVACWGANYLSQGNVYQAPAGVSWVQVAGADRHTVALRSDGEMRAWGENSYNQLAVPPLPVGRSYVEVYAGGYGSGALRDDGQLFVWGASYLTGVPALPAGTTYTSAAISWHALALRSDGQVLAWGTNTSGQCNVPALPAGLGYAAVAAGLKHSLALRSDGQVIAFGDNTYGQCTVPALPPGTGYVKIAAHVFQSSALRSDGELVLFGNAGSGAVPPLPAGLAHSDIAVGGHYSCDPYGNCVLTTYFHSLRSDGSSIAFGDTAWGTLDLPALPAGYGFLEFGSGDLHGTGVYAPTTGAAYSYCTAAVTTGGCTPLISSSGSASASNATDFALSIAPVDGQRNGLLFYGLDNSGFAPAPWGAGGTSWLCVKAPLQRTPLQTSTATPGACDGALQLDWDAFVAGQPSALGVPFSAGDRVFMQGWFRDPLAVKGTNLSNAIAFPIAP